MSVTTVGDPRSDAAAIADVPLAPRTSAGAMPASSPSRAIFSARFPIGAFPPWTFEPGCARPQDEPACERAGVTGVRRSGQLVGRRMRGVLPRLAHRGRDHREDAVVG